MATKKSKKKKSSADKVMQEMLDAPMPGASDTGGTKTHVVRKGDIVREPTEEETIASEFSKGTEVDPKDRGVVEQADELIDRIEKLRSNERVWKRKLSHVQRTALLGALYSLKEVTNKKAGGQQISLARWLGVSVETGNIIGSA